MTAVLANYARTCRDLRRSNAKYPSDTALTPHLHRTRRGRPEVRPTGNIASFVCYSGASKPIIRERLGSLILSELTDTEIAPALTAPS